MKQLTRDNWQKIELYYLRLAQGRCRNSASRQSRLEPIVSSSSQINWDLNIGVVIESNIDDAIKSLTHYRPFLSDARLLQGNSGIHIFCRCGHRQNINRSLSFSSHGLNEAQIVTLTLRVT